MHRHQKMLVALLATGVSAIPVVAVAAGTTAAPEAAKTTVHQNGGFKGMG